MTQENESKQADGPGKGCLIAVGVLVVAIIAISRACGCGAAEKAPEEYPVPTGGIGNLNGYDSGYVAPQPKKKWERCTKCGKMREDIGITIINPQDRCSRGDGWHDWQRVYD